MNLKYLLLLFFLIKASSLLAQNNLYNVDDKLFEYYQKCAKMQLRPEVLLMADTLQDRAAERNDLIAQCLALYLKMDYYYYKQDTIQLRKAVADVQSYALNTPYLQYYFGAWGRIIESQIRDKHYMDALIEAEALQKEAFSRNNSYGIANSYNFLGSLHKSLRNNKQAVDCYLKGANYHIEYGKPREAFHMYRLIGNIYVDMGQYKEAATYLYKSLALALENDRIAPTMLSLADLYAQTGRLDSASYYLDKVDSLFSISVPRPSAMVFQKRVLLNYNLAKGNLEYALALSDSVIENQKARSKYLIYSRMGKFKEALYWYEKIDSTNQRSSSEEMNSMLIAYSTRLENSHLATDKNRLALKNSKMRIAQMETERKLLEAKQEWNSLQLQTAELKLENFELSNSQQLNELEFTYLEAQIQEERAVAAEEREKWHRAILTIVSLSFLFMLFCAAVYQLVRKRNVTRLLQERNLAMNARFEAESARAEAEMSNKEKTLFLQNMSHEIRTPLNAIVGFNDVLNSGEEFGITEEERVEYLALIQQNTGLLTTLVNDVLDLSRLESDQNRLTLTRVNLTDVCNLSIMKVFSRIPPQVKAKLSLPSNRSNLFYTDAMRLQQVLDNFLTNACKHTEIGTITLGYHVLSNADVEFYVEDTGTGVPADKVDEIFLRFGKLDTFKQGTGLGLNICQSIADQLTGRIYLDTSYTKGARFVFLHPCLDDKSV